MNEKLKDIKCFLLDMDGTIYLGERVLDGAVDAVRRMRERAKVLFLTNNSSASVDDYASRLTRMGFAASRDDVYSSANATMNYLKARHPGERVYIFGNARLRRDFLAAGIELTESRPDIAVIGFHTGLTYEDLRIVCDFIREGVPYIATHDDKNCPTDGGYKPDVGSFLALIRTCTGKEPEAICGKPYPPMITDIVSLVNAERKQIAMVGDRFATDMKFASVAGFTSVLVLTGEGKREEIPSLDFDIDVVLPSIADWDK